MSNKEVRVKIVSALGDSNLIFRCDYSKEDKITLLPAYGIVRDLMATYLQNTYHTKGLEMIPPNENFYTVHADNDDTCISVSVKWGGGIGKTEALKLFEDMLNSISTYDPSTDTFENTEIEARVRNNIDNAKSIAETLKEEVFKEGKYVFFTTYMEPGTFD